VETYPIEGVVDDIVRLPADIDDVKSFVDGSLSNTNFTSNLSFFDKLNLDDLVVQLETVGTIIDICYGSEVLGNELFKEIVGKNVQLVSCKLISELGEVDCIRFREALLKLNRTNKKTKNEVTKIKLNETLNFLVTLGKNDKINNDNIVNLLQYCDLIEELKKANGK
jgi:hypothetical protein